MHTHMNRPNSSLDWVLSHLAHLTVLRFIFSKRELTFTFAICYRPSVCLSVCLSSVTLVRPTQTAVIFGNFSTAFGTLAIRWYTQKILWRSSQGTPPSGELNPREVAKYSDFGPIEGNISETVQDTRKLVLITNSNSHMSFRLVPKSVTLNDLERRSGRYFLYLSEFGSFRAHCVKVVEDIPKLSATEI